MAEGTQHNSPQSQESGDAYGRRINELVDIQSEIVKEKKRTKGGRKERQLNCFLEETVKCISTCIKKQKGEVCNDADNNYDYDDDEIRDLRKKIRRIVSKPVSTSSLAAVNSELLDPKRYGNILRIQRASVLVLAVTEFYNEPDKNRKYSDEYPSIRRFIDIFDYYDALERILINIITLNKLNFQNITIKNAEKNGISNLLPRNIDHMVKMLNKYKRLMDTIGNDPERMTQISNGTILERADELSWSKEQMELMMDISVDNETQADALMVFVGSHGRTNKTGHMEIMDNKGETIKVSCVIEKFSKNKDLRGMLFVNACRGNKLHKDEAAVIKSVNNQAQTTVSGHNINQCQNPAQAGEIDVSEEQRKTYEGRSIIAQATEESQHAIGPTENIDQRMREIDIGSGYRERQPATVDDRLESIVESLPAPVGLLSGPQTDRKPLPPPFESTGICPNNCLVLYSTTRGFMSDNDPQTGSIFISNFVQKLADLQKTCLNGIAFIPFLQMLTGELAKEDLSGDLQMLTFDHSMCEMPVLMMSTTQSL